jgi:DNA-binding NarL/FixJ family response regulator
MKRIQILIADDHGVVRSGVRALLRSSPEYRIVAEAADGQEAIDLAKRLAPDIVMMDISMPGINGIEATRILRKEVPGAKIIILTVHEDEEYVYQMLKAGASGYVLKSAGKKEIFAAIASAMSGERFFSPGVSRLIIEGFIHRDDREEDHSQAGHDSVSTAAVPLTKRESQVLQYIARGFTNREIAELLYLSVRTVNTHRTNLMQKLDLHDTARLVRYAIETGLVRFNTPVASPSSESGDPVRGRDR